MNNKYGLKNKLTGKRLKEFNACLQRFEECDAPEDVVLLFKEIVSYLEKNSKDTVRDIFRETCIRKGYTKPFERNGVSIFIRPACLNSKLFSDCYSATQVEEQCYRRGFDQGANEVFRLFSNGVSANEIRLFLDEVHAWRTRCIQIMNSSPGCEESIDDGIIIEGE
ncbi:hypothetical protein [Candidatus Magnetaquicoccus inordinatus]|uniref:hypothetical protein n=1 Tax=Candidatus Magnetaquicoccus inordinatus TaxID=2496818 RepID=UPI00102C0393|nr:hypothetical protein [Candidatus Magnetaquicoccus inordinatus]